MAESETQETDTASISVQPPEQTQALSLAAEVERLSLGHFIVHARALGVWVTAAAIATGFIARGSVATQVLLFWLALLVALGLAQWLLLARMPLTEGGGPAAGSDRPWWLFAGCNLLGAVFGLMAGQLGAGLSDLDFTLIALVQLALCSTAMVSMAAVRGCFLWFVAWILAPGISIQLLGDIQSGAGRLSVPALILAGIWIAIVLISRVLYRSMQANLLLAVEQRNMLKLLENTNRSLFEDREVLATESRTDALTGLANRRLLEESLGAEWNRCRRGRMPLSCVLLDIDHFKAYNDHFGHDGGDECLKRVAAILDDHIRRAGDLVARYGGEEFIVLLPNTDLEGGRKVAVQLHDAVLQQQIPHPASAAAVVVTISLGVASLVPSAGIHPEQLFKAADLALYEAKRQGRNRVEWASEETLDAARLALQGLIG